MKRYLSGAMLLICILLVGCSSDTGPAGKWTLCGAEVNGTQVTKEELAPVLGQEAGAKIDVALELKGDGGVNLTGIGQSLAGTWRETDEGVELTLGGEAKTAGLQEGRLVFELSGVTLIFER